MANYNAREIRLNCREAVRSLTADDDVVTRYREYTVKGYELPGGRVLTTNDSEPDCLWPSAEEFEPNGTDECVGFEHGEPTTVAVASVIESAIYWENSDLLTPAERAGMNLLSALDDTEITLNGETIADYSEAFLAAVQTSLHNSPVAYQFDGKPDVPSRLERAIEALDDDERGELFELASKKELTDDRIVDAHGHIG